MKIYKQDPILNKDKAGKWGIWALYTFVMLVLIGGFVWLLKPEHVSPDEFKEKYKDEYAGNKKNLTSFLGIERYQGEVKNSFRGCTDLKKRVFLHFYSWGNKTIYVELSELDSTFLESLIAELRRQGQCLL